MQKDFYCATDFIVDKKKEEIWYVALGYNHLCCYDYRNRIMKKRVTLPEENGEVRLFENLVKVDNYLVLIPGFARKLIVYDTEKDTCVSIPMGEYGGQNIRFFHYFVNNKIVCFFPRACNAKEINPFTVGMLNLEKMELSFSASLQELVKLPGYCPGVEVFHRDCIKLEKEVLFLYCNTNLVCVYHLADETYEMCPVGDEDNQYFTICQVDETRFCLSNQFGDIILWDRNTGKVQKIKNEEVLVEREKSELGSSEEMFRYSICYDGKVYLFPMFGNKVLQYDTEKNEISEADFGKFIVGEEKTQYPCFYSKLSNVHIVDGQLFIWNIRRGILYIIDLQSGQIEEHLLEVQMSREEIKQCRQEWCQSKGQILQESRLLYMNLQSLFEI